VVNGEPTLFDSDGSNRPAADAEIRELLGQYDGDDEGGLYAAYLACQQADAEDGAQ
jgi:hypothetical protein